MIGALGRALLLDEHRLQAHRRLAPVDVAGGREFDTAGAQHQCRAPPGPARACRALAALRARRQPVDRDHGTGTGGRRAQCLQQRGPAGNPAPALGAHQEFGLRPGALFLEQREDVRFPIHRANHPGAPEIPGQFRAVPETLDPAGALAVRRCPRSVLRRRRLEAGPENSQRHAFRRHRQCRMQVQPTSLGPGLVGADHPETLAARPRCEVEIRAVLDTQNNRFPTHATKRALPVRLQNALRRHRRAVRLVDETVIALDPRQVLLRRSRK